MKHIFLCILIACTMTACGGDQPAANAPATPTTSAPKTDAAPPAKKVEATHPWASFNAGSFAKTKSTVSTSVAGKPFVTTSTLTYTLLEKTSDKAIVELETETMGTKSKTKTEIPLTASGNVPVGNTTASSGTGAPKEGSEDVTVGGKTIHCKWVEIETNAGGSTVTSKVWTSAEVPGSVVKSVSKTSGATTSETTVELVDFAVK